MARNLTVKISAYMLSFVFITVGVSKLIGHEDFAFTLAQSPLLEEFVPLISYPLPIIEIVVGVALLVAAYRKYAMFASLLLMVLFTLYNIYLIGFAPYVPCSCGGIFKDMSWTIHLYINAFLTVLAAAASWHLQQGKPSVSLLSSTLFKSKKRRSIGTG